MELSQKGALILSSAAVFHPFPGHLMQGGCYSLSADPLQQTEPMPGGDPCSWRTHNTHLSLTYEGSSLKDTQGIHTIPRSRTECKLVTQ